MPAETAPLNPRQRKVLTAVVDQFISHAEPVSSKALSRIPFITVSPATIRTTLAELEEMGLLAQPHASAGRQPTDKGYRLYVDDLLFPEPLSEESRRAIDAVLEEARGEADLLRQVADLLGSLSHLLGVALAPPAEDGRFSHLDLVPIANNRLMVILSISGLQVRSALMEAGGEMSFLRLEGIADQVNRRMQGVPVSFLNTYFKEQLESLGSDEERKAYRFLDRSISKLFQDRAGEEVHLAGAGQVLNQPDFERIGDLSGLLEMLDSRITLVHFLRQRAEDRGVRVTVGEEHRNGRLRSISIMTSTFRMGEARGMVGVIGPKRMPYARLIPMVDYTARALNRKFAAEAA